MLGVKKALTMSDCALLTGLSKSFIYKQVSAKKIPHWKSSGGKLTYFDKDELNGWMLKHRVKTVDELETGAANYLTIGQTGKKSVVAKNVNRKIKG